MSKEFSFGSCQICSGKATGMHYGAPTCEGCKGFFKRCTTKERKFTCYFGSKCPITPDTRNACKSCRLQRCIDSGMSVDAIRMGRISNMEKEHAREQLRDMEWSFVQNIVKEMKDDIAAKKIERSKSAENLNHEPKQVPFNAVGSAPDNTSAEDKESMSHDVTDLASNDEQNSQYHNVPVSHYEQKGNEEVQMSQKVGRSPKFAADGGQMLTMTSAGKPPTGGNAITPLDEQNIDQPAVKDLLSHLMTIDISTPTKKTSKVSQQTTPLARNTQRLERHQSPVLPSQGDMELTSDHKLNKRDEHLHTCMQSNHTGSMLPPADHDFQSFGQEKSLYTNPQRKSYIEGNPTRKAVKLSDLDEDKNRTDKSGSVIVNLSAATTASPESSPQSAITATEEGERECQPKVLTSVPSTVSAQCASAPGPDQMCGDVPTLSGPDQMCGAVPTLSGPDQTCGAVPTLSSGPDQTCGAVPTLSSGPDQMCGAVPLLSSGPDQMCGAVPLLSSGPDQTCGAVPLLSSMPDQMCGAVPTLSSGPDQMCGAVPTLSSGPDQMCGAVPTLSSGPDQMCGAVPTLSSGPVIDNNIDNTILAFKDTLQMLYQPLYDRRQLLADYRAGKVTLSMTPITKEEMGDFWPDFIVDMSEENERITSYVSKVPGFSNLCMQDRVVLLKNSFVEIQILSTSEFRSKMESNYVLNKKQMFINDTFYVLFGNDKVSDFVLEFFDMVHHLHLSELEVTVLCAIVLTSMEDLEVQDPDSINKLSDHYMEVFRHLLITSDRLDKTRIAVDIFYLVLPILKEVARHIYRLSESILLEDIS